MNGPQRFWIAILFLAFFPWLPLLAQGQLPEGEGKEIVETVCTQCHGLSNITNARYPLEEWRNVLYDMISEGAPLLDDEVETVAQYLAKHFGPESSSGSSSKNTGEAAGKKTISVNPAAAQEPGRS